LFTAALAEVKTALDRISKQQKEGEQETAKITLRERMRDDRQGTPAS